MDKKYYRSKTTEDLNKISVRCMRVVLVFLVLFYAIMFIINRYNPLILTISGVLCVLVVIIPCIYIPLFRMYSMRITRHIIITCTILTIGILITEFNTIVYPMILFPILLASMYSNRTFVLFTSLVESATMLCSAWFQFNYPQYVLRYNFESYEDIFLTMTFPIIFTIIFMSFIAFFIVSRNSQMSDKYIETAITMTENQKYLIYAFSEMSETKSLETGEHIKRVAEYMKVLGHASGFDDEYNEKVATAAMMHDLGKLMIPEEILNKPSKLTDEEFSILKSHVLYGEALLKDCPGEIMKLAAIMAKEHHERWDGTGYLGMKGKEIAYISRLIAVADVFDALTSERSYKKGWTVEEAYDEIIKNSGKHFDPAVVRLFIKNREKFKEIHDAIPDTKVRNQ
ncbi:MAG: HD-GYP domain-containing protein [Eubacterium sp.]|nr:HD-GYP domain-containing protein [Eubacterium sp.]